MALYRVVLFIVLLHSIDDTVVSQVLLVFRDLTARLVLPVQLEVQDFPDLVDSKVQLEPLDFLDRLDHPAGKEIGETQDLLDPQVIFLCTYSLLRLWCYINRLLICLLTYFMVEFYTTHLEIKLCWGGKA